MQMMDKLRKCAEKMGYRLDVPPEFERIFNEAYDSCKADFFGHDKVEFEKHMKRG
jgi:hypothetical protein